MIRIIISKREDVIDKINFLGHAMFAPHGKDIVCAGVSSILTTTVNGILRMNAHALTHKHSADRFDLYIHEHDKVTETLLENMIELLKSVETSYPKNITVEEENTK